MIYHIYINEIKNAPSALLSYISTRKFLRTQEKCARTSWVFLKIPKCLYNSTMHEEQVFYFFYKIKTTTRDKNSSDDKNEREF